MIESMILTFAQFVISLATMISNWLYPVLGVYLAILAYRLFFVIDWDDELIKAVKADNISKIQLAIKKGAKLQANEDKDTSPLIVAIEKCNSAAVSTLLAAGAKTEARDLQGRTPLIHAVSSGSVDVVQMLLAKGANANAKCYEGMTPLITAARE